MYLPGAYLQFVRIEGDSFAEPIIDEKRLDAPLASLLRQLDEVLTLNIHSAVTIGTGARDERQPDYPLQALQQITRNALLHRSYEGTHSPARVTWYSDRIEIHSPGGPYGAVTPENFGRSGVTDYRNPVLAEAMRNLGFVQRFGAGLPLARKALATNGNPEPEFTVDHSYVGIIVRAAG
jgi:ATP-dependent DNA helicase RecG